MKKVVFKVGDLVKVANPEIFVRCGYPFSLQYAIDNLVTTKDRSRITKLLGVDNYGHNYIRTKAEESITRALGYLRLSEVGFGGKEKKVFTERKDIFLGLGGKIVDKKVVRTGTYNHGSSSEYDYEPSYLDDIKSHVILTVEICHDPENKLDWGEERKIKIESIHLEKI